MSSIPTEKKVTMSLDDIAKARQAEAKATKSTKPQKKTPAKPAPTTTKAAGAQKKRRGKGSANGAASSTPALTKVAQSVGAAQAKRAAATAQRRGLADTGKATKAQVKKQVGKAAKQMQTQAQAQQGGRRRGNGNSAPVTGRPSSAPAKLPSLKISFKPAELNKTTEKIVSLQIKAVLQKTATGSSSNNTTRNNNNGPRSVQSSNSAGSRRANPKARRPRGPR